MQTHEIIGLGYCNLDYLGIVPEIPLDDKVEIIKTLVQGGGPAATAVYAASRLGASTAFIGCIGNDERGKAIIAEMNSGRINLDSTVIREKGESPAGFCWVEAVSGKRSIMWTRGTVAPLAKNEVNVELIKTAKLLHLDGHHPEAALFAAETARKNGVTVSLDAGTLLPGIERLMELADIIIASEKFAVKISGQIDPEIAVHKLFTRNCKFLAVTLGAAGCIGFDGKTVYRQTAFPVKTVDTTGAGDVFHGAFAYQYVNGGSWQECMRFAAAVAALKCTQLGGRSGIPTIAEAKQFLNERKND